MGHENNFAGQLNYPPKYRDIIARDLLHIAQENASTTDLIEEARVLNNLAREFFERGQTTNQSEPTTKGF